MTKIIDRKNHLCFSYAWQLSEFEYSRRSGLATLQIDRFYCRRLCCANDAYLQFYFCHSWFQRNIFFFKHVEIEWLWIFVPNRLRDVADWQFLLSWIVPYSLWFYCYHSWILSMLKKLTNLSPSPQNCIVHSLTRPSPSFTTEAYFPGPVLVVRYFEGGIPSNQW